MTKENQMRQFIELQEQNFLLRKELNGYDLYCRKLEEELFSRTFANWQQEVLKRREAFNSRYGYKL